ncbi:MAG: SDR family NAD(P)-dependent oxidoreductase, partial [Pseudomonadota bacterium]|nr:SDR family NAD(P)-dependent oxidoreductase [Pseudomonadota bacterium]
MKRFSGQVGMVTGSSEGIGYAIAERLIQEGAHIVICGRRADVLEDAAEKLGEQCTPIVLDVGDTKALVELVE